MKKVFLIPLLFIFACLVAGLYGVIHNQVSYTVSLDYFHQYKFIQFNIASSFQNRIGASIVGWHASWWMGIVIGIIIIPVGLIIPTPKKYLITVSKSFSIVAFTSFITGISALVYAFLTINNDNVQEIIIYNNTISDPTSFMRAGTMHNFSYIGGLLGI